MGVKQIFVPMRAVFGVGQLGVETHDGGEELGEN